MEDEVKPKKLHFDVIKEKYYNDVTNVEKARICSEINTKSMLWGVAPRTLKVVKAPTILLPIGGGRGGGGIWLAFSCLIDFFFMSVGIQILFSHIR
jgi:hypothetical protein